MWADQAWRSVTPITIGKCFKKAGFETETQEEDRSGEEEEDRTPKQFNTLAKEITGVDFNDLPTIENEVSTENENAYNWDQPAADILQQIRENEQEDMNEEEEGQTEDEDYTATEETESDSDSKVGRFPRVFKFKSDTRY